VFKITFKKKAAKELLKLPKAAILKLSKSIDGLQENPRPEGSKKLKGSREEMWRIRSGNYRVLYVIENEVKIVSIRKVGHRKDVYE
jgi:mRNA interferase RelE/StbE